MDYCQITTKVFISSECGNFLRWPGHTKGSALAISSCKKQTTGLLYICRPTWASGSLWWPPLLGQEAQWDVQWMILPESQGGALNCPSWLALGSAGLLGKKKPSCLSRCRMSFMSVRPVESDRAKCLEPSAYFHALTLAGLKLHSE